MRKALGALVCFIRLWPACARIIFRRSREANLWNEWPELHLLRPSDLIKHNRETARILVLILLPRRTIAIRINLWLEVELDKVITRELPKFECLEEEVEAKS